MSTAPEIDSRIERLEQAVRDIDARLAKLERRRGGGSEPAERRLGADATPRAEENVLALLGICSLILGGAFVLRALTESQMIPRLGGAILGLAYAVFWIWRANRFYAITGAIIAFPLVWETTVRFRVVPPIVAGILVGILGLFFVWIAVRSDQQLLAWIGSAAAIAAAFAIGPSPVMLIAISAIGTATAWFAKKWEFAAWPAALASNIIALILLFTKPEGTAIVLIAYAVLWLPMFVQSSIALLIGVGGATYLLIPGREVLSMVWFAAGLIATEVARRMASRTIAVQGVVWIVAASALLFEAPLVPGAVALGAFLRTRREWLAERIVLLSIVLVAAFLAVNAIVTAPLYRTAILAVFASLLAIVRRLTGNREALILAHVVLVAGGLQVVIEDLRLSAAMMVVALALYGAALIIVARVSRGTA